MAGANSVIDRIPAREGFTRRIVSEAEYHEMKDRGWEPPTTSDGKEFQHTFNDRAAGKQFVMELPNEKMSSYQREYQGGRLTEMQQESLLGSRKDKEGGETVTVENRQVPRQANIRRKGA